jgi:hypothetical protein
MHGFFAHLEWDIKEKREELRLLMDASDILLPIPIHLIGTLEEALAEVEKVSRETARNRLGFDLPSFHKEHLKEVAPLVSLLLYLCSQAAEIRDAKGADRLPKNPKPQKTKHGFKTIPASNPTAWEVAFRLGAALRTVIAEERERDQPVGSHSSPRPHIRCAHWHSFWSGSRADSARSGSMDRKLILKWLPPIPVNIRDTDDIVPALRSVN